MSTKPVYIVDEIAAVVAAVDAVTYPVLGKHINYMYGHKLEVVSRLQQMTNSTDMAVRGSKFPLFYLVEDFRIQKGVGSGMVGKAYLNILIANITKPEYTSEQREEINFRPVLVPIYEALMDQLEKNPTFPFEVYSRDAIKHDYIQRKFFGKEGLYGSTGNVFNDYIDAIEIVNMELTVRNKYY